MENSDYREFDGYEGPAFFCVVYRNFYPETAGTQTLILEDGTEINVDQDHEYLYTFFDYYKQFYKNSFIDRFEKPHIIYTGIGSIRQFENMILSHREIDHLNNHGLYIFLYENLIFEVGEKKKFYINENKSYIPNSFCLQFEVTSEILESIYSFELESIKEFVIKNNLKSVYVLTCEYGSGDFLEGKYTNFKIGTKDIFIHSLFETVTDKIPNSYQYNHSLIDKFSSNTLIYKFWCTNWRYDVHRHFMALYLADKSALLSWPYKNSIEEVKKNIWFDLDSWKCYPIYDKLKINDKIITRKEIPFVIDLPLEEPTLIELDQLYNTPASSLPATNPNADLIPLDYLEKCFCAVITESAYVHPLANFTEKTVTIIKSMRPFVIVAPPRTLEYLRTLGFKTFQDVWDESYDQELNHERRLLKIFEVLEWIDSRSIDELKILYQNLLPILRHNFNLLKTIKQDPSLLLLDTCDL